MRAMTEAARRKPDKGNGDGPTWRKAVPTVLTRTMTAGETLTVIVRGCIEHLRANEICVLARAHEEGVHQMRVATRRLRSSFSLYKTQLPAEQRANVTDELRWLIGELGPARDWDVFLSEVLKPVLRRMPSPDEKRLELLRERAKEQRDLGYERAQAAIRSERYLELMGLLDACAELGWWRQGTAYDGASDLDRPAIEIAHGLLEERCQRVREASKTFESLNPTERHKLRIQIKKLRYAAEFFGSLYPKRQFTPYIVALKDLQDLLGAANDVEVACNLLASVVKPLSGKERARLSYAAGLVVGWHSHLSEDHEQRLVGVWQQFEATKPFWIEDKSASEESEVLAVGRDADSAEQPEGQRAASA